MRICRLSVLLILFALMAKLSYADDQSRIDANLILRKASDLETFNPGEAPKYRLEVRFSFLRQEKEVGKGVFTREVESPVLWHEDLEFGEFRYRRVRIKKQIWTSQNYDFVPMPVQGLWGALYWTNFRLADSDIVKRVRDRKIGDVAARCVEIESVAGKEKENREVCVQGDTGYVVYGLYGDRRFSYSEFAPVGPRVRPRRIAVDFNESDRIVAEVNYNEVERFDPVGFEPIVGGEVRDACTATRPPVAKSATDPKYPPNVRPGYHGKIVLELKIDQDGHVLNAAVLQSLQTDLDADALRVVKTWEFEPGTCDGKPTTSFTKIEVTYHSH
jgi:TonB family protein